MSKRKIKLPVFFALAIICLSNLEAQKISSPDDIVVDNSNLAKNAVFNNDKFITIKGSDGTIDRAYIAGPEDAKAGILFVHDYFGISDAAKESVERLAALGYRVIAVDLYKGRSATTNDSAVLLMKAKDSSETSHILAAGIDYLKKPGRKLAAVGFSAGGVDAMKATLMEPELFSATVIVYGGDYDKIEKSRLDKLKTPVLAITGSLDNWPLQAALNFLKNENEKLLELYVYPGADHGYAQPLFNGGKNYNAEATRVTWMLMTDFLSRHLNF
jgi:carboxymethylenebutenolidase